MPLWVQAQQHAKQTASENGTLGREVAEMRHAFLELQAAHVKPTMATTLRVGSPCP